MAYEAKPNTGSFFKNDNKEKENQPDYTGSFVDANGKQMRSAAWIRESKSGKTYMSFVISEPYKKDDGETVVNAPVEAGGDLPF